VAVWPSLSQGHFARAWSAAIDKGLVPSTGGTDERLAAGLALLRAILPSLPDELIAHALSAPMVRALISHAHTRGSAVHSAVQATLRALSARTRTISDDKSALAALGALTGKYGSKRFDAVTHSDVVAKLLDALQTEGVASFVAQLVHDFCRPPATASAEQSADDAAAFSRPRALELLLAVMRNKNLVGRAGLRERMAKFFFFHGHFMLRGDGEQAASHLPAELDAELRVVPQPRLRGETRERCRQAFANLLNDLLTPQPLPAPEVAGDQPAPRSRRSAIDDESRDTLERTLIFANGCLNHDGYVLTHTMSKETTDALARLAALTEKAGKCARLRTPKAKRARVGAPGAAPGTQAGHDAVEIHKAFHVLFLHLSLQLFAGGSGALDDVMDVERAYGEFAHEVEAFHKGPSATAKSSAHTGGKDEGEDEDEDMDDAEDEPPHPTEVLVDVLLSLLSRPSAMLRRVVNDIFPSVAHSMTPTALNLIGEALRQPLGSGVLELEDDDDDGEGGLCCLSVCECRYACLSVNRARMASSIVHLRDLFPRNAIPVDNFSCEMTFFLTHPIFPRLILPLMHRHRSH
jgi:DNA polymerase phi